MAVNAAGISVKVEAHYTGRSVNLPCATGISRCQDELAEVSRRHSRLTRYADDVNIYVGSMRAGQRVLDSIKRFLARQL